MPKYKEYFRFNFLLFFFLLNILVKICYNYIFHINSLYFYNFLLFYCKNDLINIRYSLNFFNF